MLDINELRKEIDVIDKSFVELFERRMKIVEKIAEYKLENKMDVFDKNRENLLLEKTEKQLKDRSLAKYLNIFFINLMDVSKTYQKKKLEFKIPSNTVELKKANKIAYQGILGSFSYSAMKKYFANIEESQAFEQFEEVFDKVESGEFEYGILPFENSSTGAIRDNYDLVRDKKVYIVGEVLIPISHNIMALKGAKLEDLEELYSHPQAFEQSSLYLKNKNFKLIPYKNTALSAEYVAKSDNKKIGAIASEEAGEIYNLEILEKSINDSQKNNTRFIIISKDFQVKKDANKISIVFSTLHKAGELFNIMSSIASRGINMLNIKSIPILEKPWEYFFYIDINGNIEEKQVKEALKEIEEKSNFFKLLGNYEEVI